MIELLRELEGLTQQVEDALIHMDAPRVGSLTMLQTTCFGEIERLLKDQPDLRDEISAKMMELKPLFERNKLLLQNAMNMTNHIIQESMVQNHISFDERG